MAYRALMLEAFVESADAFTSTVGERANAPDAFWNERVSDPDGKSAVFGAYSDTLLVGTVGLLFSEQEKTRHKALVVAMYVKPEFRGQGLSRLLLQQAIEFASARAGVDVLTLTVTQGNGAAESLYQSLGFTEFGLEPRAVIGTNGYLAKKHMWLELTK